MLVLTRKKYQSVVINDETTVTVLEVRGDVVRLGIEAPKEIPVYRSEIWEAVRGEQRLMHSTR